MKDFIFGKLVCYEIVTDTKIFNIGGRSYSYKDKLKYDRPAKRRLFGNNEGYTR